MHQKCPDGFEIDREGEVVTGSTQHLNVGEATIAKFPKNRPEIMPE